MNKFKMLKGLIKTRSKLHIEFEKWKWNDEVGLYVSSYGNLRSFAGDIIYPKINRGYLMICDRNGEWVRVHHLVMNAFKPIPNPESMTVDHLDHNTRNNRVSNLEWVTREENSARARRDDVTNLNEHNRTISKVKMVELNQVLTLEHAAKFLLTTPGMKNDQKGPSLEKAMDGIWRAAINENGNHKYANYTWKLILGESDNDSE